MAYQSKFKGAEIDALLDKVQDGTVLETYTENGSTSASIVAEDTISASAETITMEGTATINLNATEVLANNEKVATESDLAKKQDTLTAGDNVVIDNNVISVTIPYDEEKVAYGIRRNINDSSPDCERIGNMDLHRTLPVQSLVRGCLLDDDGNVVEYLPDSDWTGATLDGSKGQVMVEFPQHYRKCQLLDDGTMEVWLSLYYLPGYESIPKMYVSAYEATVQRSTNKLSSVMSDDPDYRGGNNNADKDGTYNSQLGTPAANITMRDFLTYARNRGSVNWNSYLYEAHKAMIWFYVVEYATLNTQKAYNADLTDEGYHQGGLGTGATGQNGTRLQNFNGSGYYSAFKCGCTNELGNHTGTVPYTMPFEYDASPTSATGLGTLYVGEYDEGTEYVVDNYVSEGDLLYRCIVDAPAGTPLTDTTYFSSVTRTVINLVRYRCVEHPFGDLYKLMCDYLCVAHPSEESGGEGDGLNYHYKCEDPEKYGGTTSDLENYSFMGTSPGSPTGSTTLYPTQIIFGSSGEWIGKNEGGSTSTFYCDGMYVNNAVTEETLRAGAVGGYLTNGAYAGLFYVRLVGAPSSSSSYCGSRLCFKPTK